MLKGLEEGKFNAPILQQKNDYERICTYRVITNGMHAPILRPHAKKNKIKCDRKNDIETLKFISPVNERPASLSLELKH